MDSTDATDAGKASSFDNGLHKPAAGSGVNGGFRPTHTPGRSDNPIMNVEPPRREDLQPSYAQTLTGESDQGNHGWYGSMSRSTPNCAHHDREPGLITV
jgi:erythrocyte band 7 integral membrane protein